jgi:hypothetical protein
MKNAFYRDVALRKSCVNRRFRGTYRLHLQGCLLVTCSGWFLARGSFCPEDGGDTFLRNVGSHKISETALFVCIVVLKKIARTALLASRDLNDHTDYAGKAVGCTLKKSCSPPTQIPKHSGHRAPSFRALQKTGKRSGMTTPAFVNFSKRLVLMFHRNLWLRFKILITLCKYVNCKIPSSYMYTPWVLSHETCRCIYNTRHKRRIYTVW